MGLATRRRNQKIGQSSNAMIIPSGLEVGDESSIAANRLILVDPRGEIPENELLKFLEENIEARFWKWYESHKKEEEPDEEELQALSF